MSHKWSDNDEKILLFLALEHGGNNYKAISKAWRGHSLRGITERLRAIRSGAKRVGVVQYFSAGGRVKTASPRSRNKRRIVVNGKPERATERKMEEGLYDGTPYVDSNDDGYDPSQADVKAAGVYTANDPPGSDRKLRDRTHRVSFSGLYSPQNDSDEAEDDEDTDENYVVESEQDEGEADHHEKGYNSSNTKA